VDMLERCLGGVRVEVLAQYSGELGMREGWWVDNVTHSGETRALIMFDDMKLDVLPFRAVTVIDEEVKCPVGEEKK
jgi:hypothetical protein